MRLISTSNGIIVEETDYVPLGEQKMKRIMFMTLENDTIGDGLWVPTIIKSLREYADLLEEGRAGQDKGPAVHESTNGNRITVMAGSWLGKFIKDTEAVKYAPFVAHKDDVLTKP